MEQTVQTEQRVRITSHSMAEQYGRKTSYLDARIRTLKRRLSYDEWHDHATYATQELVIQ